MIKVEEIYDLEFDWFKGWFNGVGMDDELMVYGMCVSSNDDDFAYWKDVLWNIYIIIRRRV